MDMYESLSQLKETEDPSAWAQCSVNRGSHITVVAPHGGTIEPLTERLAADIAGLDYNLFVFKGLRPDGDILHVTSHNFQDKELQQLQLNSRLTLSVHGLSLTRHSIMVGGLNSRMAKEIISALLRHGFPAEQAGFPYAGIHPDNFVNRTPEQGVQLEISAGQRKAMLHGQEPNNQYWMFVSIVRQALGRA